ncbi:MAG: LacI family DNA-binding transcriptional regulator [Hyphomicrobiales bacterium]
MDVAALAGVSHITVSRVINKTAPVKVETRARVVAAMLELGYQPNFAARALVTGRSRTIGVISYNTALYGPAAAMQGLERAASDAGYFVAVAGLETLDRLALRRALDRLRQQAVAGIVIISPQLALAEAFADLPHDVPIVALWGQKGTNIPVVASSEAQGAGRATFHLLDLGHRTVWHLCGPSGRFGAEERIRGWREALIAARLDPPPIRAGDWTARSGYEGARDMIRDPAVTALFVASDQMALGVLRAASEAGRHVPEDLSIVGFDDIPEAAFYTPPLTTVRQNFWELGQAAVDLLLPLLHGKEPMADAVVCPAELVIRQSTAKPPR